MTAGALLNRVLRLAGVELRRVAGVPAGEATHDPRSSYMDDPALQEVLLTELAQTADAFFATSLSDLQPDLTIGELVRDFWRIYRGRPFTDNVGGSGFHNAFWIYLLAKIMAPRLVVESGVWKGHSSWLLEQACPDAEIHGFDLDLSRLEHKQGRIRYHEHDWAQYRFQAVEAERALVFFDCHVDHARRIREAHARGFRHLLFDDNPPLHKLYAYGLPGFPTVEMVRSGPPQSETTAWHWYGRAVERAIDAAAIEEARALIESCHVFPDVGSPTRYGGFSFLTYVRLISP